MPEPQNNQPADQVWISREEYDRLRSQQPVAVPLQTGASPQIVYSANSQAEMAASQQKSTPFGVIQVIVGALLALMAFAYPPMVLLFALFGAFSVYDYMKSRHGKPKEKQKTYLIFLLIPLALAAAPVLMIIVMLAIYTIQCSVTTCQSS